MAVAPKKSSGPGAASRRKKFIIPVAVLLPLLIALAVVCLRTDREALTPKEILEKQHWTDAELQRALARSFQLKSDRDNRHEVMRHLRDQLKERSEDDQRKIRLGATLEALNDSLNQFRMLTEEDRKKILARMNEQADKNYNKLKTMSSADREKLREELASDESKVVMTEINGIVNAKMTPEERSSFAPLTRKWLKTIREI